MPKKGENRNKVIGNIIKSTKNEDGINIQKNKPKTPQSTGHKRRPFRTKSPQDYFICRYIIMGIPTHIIAKHLKVAERTVNDKLRQWVSVCYHDKYMKKDASVFQSTIQKDKLRWLSLLDRDWQVWRVSPPPVIDFHERIPWEIINEYI